MVSFWNGNKSPARQQHELEVLQTLLAGSFPAESIQNDMTSYPDAEDESNVFLHGTDVLVTVAGNQKFAAREFYPVQLPLCQGILGCRLLIIRKEDTGLFESITFEQLQHKIAGIPDTWADADLFRHNTLPVLETGTIEDILFALKNGLCDYVSLGINEAEDILSRYPAITDSLCIDPTSLIYYPLPLVFYVSPARPELKILLEKRLKQCHESGVIHQLIQQHYGQYIRNTQLKSRHVIHLSNPFLPATLEGFECSCF
ncbi:transporter substrate-binding domain-containing protein [Vibrio quintilis]|uniref:Bacterial extracellular solute-binding proteins, family 3 n=1 Tax=Vibrio quintilis TaxID=1117707 RepID=A0A1M7YSZ7_9VIBR|nr:transporter substrate-binding domain-containing protein [Vibrio quintilis]SHO55750.1 Bacterial extracellular solute-binding proteins, family 3 [Vibrio quintilis]